MAAKVLMVDDEPLMHQLYRCHLERAGFQVLDAMDGREAVDKAAQENPELIVMDIIMPGMDGLAAVLEIKKAESTRAIPIIMVTASPTYPIYQRQFQLIGAVGFLTKPFSPAKLLAEIRRFIPNSG